MMWLVQILFITGNLFIAFILHNSERVGYCGDREPIPFKMPLFKWILWGIATLIPILNIIVLFGLVMWTIAFWTDSYRIRNKDHWLFKEY